MKENGGLGSSNPTRTNMTIRACAIRDGTPGISLSMGSKIVGEWTDSRAKTLLLTDEYKVAVCGMHGEQLYLFRVPGKVLSGEQTSATSVTMTFEI